jgi:FkbM family methyltransferase
MTRLSWQQRLRRLGHRSGFDVARWPSEQLGYYRTKALLNEGIDLVVDVGANDGGYGRELRDFGYTSRIVSFEPVEEARRRLDFIRDDRWAVLPFALGGESDEAAINVAGNSEASSSILMMTQTHESVAPHARFIRTEPVQMRRLDDMWSEVVGNSRRPFLKLDVQGYEAEVLRGADNAVNDFVGIMSEVSLVPVYRGAPTWLEIVQWMSDRGFEVYRLDPGFTDPRTGQMLQCDATFFHHTRSKIRR